MARFVSGAAKAISAISLLSSLSCRLKRVLTVRGSLLFLRRISRETREFMLGETRMLSAIVHVAYVRARASALNQYFG